MPHDEKHYYETKKLRDEDVWKFRIYRYDASGNRKIIVHESDFYFYTKGEADDAATDWAEDNGIDVRKG